MRRRRVNLARPFKRNNILEYSTAEFSRHFELVEQTSCGAAVRAPAQREALRALGYAQNLSGAAEQRLSESGCDTRIT